jgi:hypothetical protein
VPTKIKVPKRVEPQNYFWGYLRRGKETEVCLNFFLWGKCRFRAWWLFFWRTKWFVPQWYQWWFFKHPSSKSAMHSSRSSRSTRSKLRSHGKVVPPSDYDDSPAKRQHKKRITKPNPPSIQHAISKKATASLTTRTARTHKSSSSFPNKNEDIVGVSTAPAGHSRDNKRRPKSSDSASSSNTKKGKESNYLWRKQY